MQLRPLGTTGMMVSVIGLGAFKLGRDQQHHFDEEYELPTAREATGVLNQVLDAGITLIDTAPAYGLSEERIGQAISHRRDEFVLATKVGEEFSPAGSRFDFSAATVRASVERSLARMRTDRLDLVCVHSDGNDLAIQQQTDIVETLLDLKSRSVRTIGFSAKTVEGARQACHWADVIMVAYNSTDPSFADVIHEAHHAGVGVIIKKGLASGRLPAAEAIPCVLGHPGVSSLLIGSRSAAHLRENITIAETL